MKALAALSLPFALLAGCRDPQPDQAGVDLDAATTDVDVAPARPAAELRVATFNVHRYFDTACDSGRCAAGDFEAAPSPEEFARTTATLAYAIDRLDVDAVLLQEVETEAALFALRDRLGPAWRTALLGETGAPGSMDVAVLSRDPLVDARRHRDAPITRPDGTSTVFSREFLEVELDHAGRRAVLFVAHFRSMVDDDPGRRAAEGQAARAIVAARAAESPDALVVMGGDLNDAPGSAALNALTEGGELARVAAALPPGADGTWRGASGAIAFDHLLLASSTGRVIPGSVSVRWDAPPARGYGGSDHAALVAGFAWR